MEFKEILEWAFQRHLNPISWYIRPLFLIALCFFAYKRSWKGILITFFIMMSSMIWFPAPGTIDKKMEEVLAFEKKVLSAPGTAFLTLGLMFTSLFFILYSFWKRSLKTAFIILNLLVVGKLILSLIFTGDAGWEHCL